MAPNTQKQQQNTILSLQFKTVYYMAVNSPVEPKQSPAATEAGEADGPAGGGAAAGLAMGVA
jgi:hypothetical protein